MNIIRKFSKMIENCIQSCIKKYNTANWIYSIQQKLVIKSFLVIQNKNRQKKKNPMLILIDGGKALDKIQFPWKVNM